MVFGIQLEGVGMVSGIKLEGVGMGSGIQLEGVRHGVWYTARRSTAWCLV